MAQNFLLWGFVAVIVLALVDYGRTSMRKSLRKLPGPILARFSGLYRLSMVINGDSPQNYRQIHNDYGKIVRVGPNHVSVSDTSEINTIYGIGSKFRKVRISEEADKAALIGPDSILRHNDTNVQRPKSR